MTSRLKELEEENRWLRRMYVKEKLKAEIAAEAIEKKWRGLVGDARWPNVLCENAGCRPGLPARSSGSASPAVSMRLGHGPKPELIDPAKPNQNACVGSFIGRLREECLNEQWFIRLTHAPVKIERWRREYNQKSQAIAEWIATCSLSKATAARLS